MRKNSSLQNMNGKILINFALLATLVGQAAGKLIIKPRDNDVKVNHSTYFNCSTDIESRAIFWLHGIKFVYTGTVILEPYNERFEINRNEWNGTYIYNLVIRSVQPEDAGEYTCHDDEWVGEKHSVQLVVLEDDPICRSNRELEEVIGQNTCNIEPDEVELECSVTYHDALSDNSTVNRTTSDEIHCSANTSQSCSYKWKWLQDNYFTIESSTSVLKAGKPGWHRCEAECYLRNTSCNLLVMKALIHGETESSQAGTTMIYVVISAVVTLVVVGALIFVFRSRKDGNSNASPEEQPLLDEEHLERHVIGSNYQFLVENIRSSHLIDLLHEKNCITDEKRADLSNHSDNFHRNEALLQWMRTITFNEEKCQKVLKCFRQAEQHLIADILVKGGVVIKSKISSNLLNERQICSLLTKSSNTNADGHREEEAIVIEILNQPQGLSLYSTQSATSEIPVDDIVITPYCHQEANGIVIWFWCLTKDGQLNLKSMFESGILFDKVSKIFKEFANDSVSEILVQNGITMFVGDFMKSETIYGIAVLGQEVFIVRLLRPDIEVYDATTFRLKRRMTVEGMKNPENLVSCSVNNCLYTFDWDYQDQKASDWDNQGQTHAILRIDPTDGNLIKAWNIDEGGGRLSVANDTNVILNLNYKAKLHEYTADGELIRVIDLDPMCTEINRSWHALKLDNGEFVVCHGSEEDPKSRVCLLSVKSTNTSTMGRTDEAEFLKAFGAQRGELLLIDILMGPTYLSLDKEGSILVSDASKKTVLLSSNLDEPQIIVSEEHGLMESRTTCFDKLTDQWFVAGQKRVMVCLVKDKEVERKLYYLI